MPKEGAGFLLLLLNNLLYGEPSEGCLPFILLSQTEDCSKGKAKGDGISAKIVFNAGVTKLFVSEFFTRETSKERKLIGFDKLSSLFISPDFFLDKLPHIQFDHLFGSLLHNMFRSSDLDHVLINADQFKSVADWF